jgi:hypothetical protein
MDLPAVERLYILTDAILDFIVDVNHLGKNLTVLHTFNVVTHIQHIVAPLLTRRNLSPYLLQSLVDTEVVLLGVRKNLDEWNRARSKPLRAVISGRSMSKGLKKDRDCLIAKHAVLQGAVQVVTDIHGYNILTQTSSISPHSVENKSVRSLKVKMKMTNTDQASIFEADQYWKSQFGESSSADIEEFCQVLALWMGEPFSDLATKRLLLRLDEANTGSISFSTFQHFVRQGNVRETVKLYTSDPHLPLLVWIDDDESAIPSALEAAGQGITVLQLVSTAAVKKWVMINIFSRNTAVEYASSSIRSSTSETTTSSCHPMTKQAIK